MNMNFARKIVYFDKIEHKDGNAVFFIIIHGKTEKTETQPNDVKEENNKRTFCDHRQTCENAYVCMSHLTCAFHPQNWLWQCQCLFRFTLDYSHVKFDLFYFYQIFFFALGNFQSYFTTCTMWPCTLNQPFNIEYVAFSYKTPYTLWLYLKAFTYYFFFSHFNPISSQVDPFVGPCCLFEHAFFILHCDAITI